MNEQTAHVELTTEVAYHSGLADRFTQLAAGEGLWHIRGRRWSTEEEQLPHGDELVASISYHFDGAQEHIARFGDSLIWLRLKDGHAIARAAAADAAELPETMAWIAACLPEAPQSEEEAVRIEFWNWSSDGPESTNRLLKVTTWRDVLESYAPSTRDGLESLMTDFAPGERGRLLLWHGAPGTGKTSALRALAWEWRAWCDVHYITDPETFFGREPGYMLRLLTQPSMEEGRWRLLVLEDTGELMRYDAKDQSGQGLSRLLNLVDGLIGQGFPVLVLVTTNEPLGSMHAAVARPGRCISNIEFDALPAGHAAAWLRARGCEANAPGELTLAECYALVAGEDLPVRHPIGFTGG